MISDPSDIERHLIFKALVHAIKTNSGIGFHNADQGHPAYVAGANGDESETWGDSQDRNSLFLLIESFPPEFHETYADLRTWEKFCTLAVKAHNEARGP